MFTTRSFRTVALVEATTFLALLVATAVKYSSDAPVGVQILGPIHGIMFLAYVAIALVLRVPSRWTNRETILILLGAVLPFGGFAVDRWLAGREQPGLA